MNVYPLFENAIRGAKGRDVPTHLKAMGKLFSPFSKVASENPYSWFPTYRSAEEIATPSEKNRFVGFPYTKYLNAVIEVDQAAALIMTSVAKARELGIPESKWVYLHGCADASEIWNVTERVNYYTSPAIRMIGKKAFAMAGLDVGDLTYIDLYSCFPSAVELACRELGIAEDDPRGLTVTGGLPYFGGAGNNYVMHSVATMLDKLRARPGAFGLCTGNGWYVTKHSAGIYSTKPTEGRWQREDPKSYQKEIDAEPHPAVVEKPEGRATIETYTVVMDRKGKRFGIVVGRLEDGKRFLANTPDDDATLDWMMQEEMLGRAGTVSDDGAEQSVSLWVDDASRSKSSAAKKAGRWRRRWIAQCYPPEVMATIVWRDVTWAHADKRIFVRLDGEPVCHAGLYFRDAKDGEREVRICGIGGVMTLERARKQGCAGAAMKTAARIDERRRLRLRPAVLRAAQRRILRKPRLADFRRRCLLRTTGRPHQIRHDARDGIAGARGAAVTHDRFVRIALVGRASVACAAQAASA